MNYVATTVLDEDAEIHGRRCLLTLAELYRVIPLPDTREIEVRKDFSQEYFTPTSLSYFIDNVHTVNGNIKIITNESQIQLYADMVRDLRNMTNLQEYKIAMVKRPKDVIATIHSLCDNYLNGYSEMLVANAKASQLYLQVSNLQRELADALDKIDTQVELKNQYAAKLHTLVSRINYNYNIDVNETKMFKFNRCAYSKVLYVKEVTRVKYVDTLLRYISEIIKTLYGMPVRMVVIEPYYAYQRAKMYPNFKPHYNLTYEDVYVSDIFMAGYQPSLMEDILANPSKVNYLIVLDRCGLNGIQLEGTRIETIYTVSDTRDITDSSIIPERVISYSDKTLYIPHIKDFNQMSIEEKYKEYSSMSVTKKLIDLIERR